MRQAGTITEQKLAQRFSDYLLTLGISSRVDPEGDAWAVWVHDEQYLDKSRRELESFVATPDSPRYDVSPEALQVRRARAEQQEALARNQVNLRRRSGRPGRFPLTKIVLGLMILITVASDFGDRHVVAKWFFIAPFEQFQGVIRWAHLDAIRQGQIWRLVTPIFMHGDFIHLAFGLLMFYQFGRLIEERRGTWRLLLLIVVVAVTSNLAEYYLADPKDWRERIIDPAPNFLGMSGVIYGLFGYAWMQGRFDPSSGLQLHPQAVVILVGWLFICLIGFMPIANNAHFSGVLVGMALGYAPILWRQVTS